MTVNENKLSKYPIQMTSNSTPEPFKLELVDGTPNIDLYRIFDGETSFASGLIDVNKLYFKLTLDKKILIKKFQYVGQTGLNYKIYGLDDNENKILITSGNTTQSDYISSEWSCKKIFENNQVFNKYLFEFDGKVYISEFHLFYKKPDKIIKKDNNFIGIDSSNDQIVLFDDIKNYKSYNIVEEQISSNIDKLKNHYPFRVLKFITQ